MSTDAITEALLATCKSSIKSLSQSLTTLHSINALHRLKEKAEVVDAFSTIISFVRLLVEDGRDEDVPASSQSIHRHPSSAPLPQRHLIHPVRRSEVTPAPFAPEEKSLPSFLIHFPVYRALGAVLSVKDREQLFSLPVMAKWGFGRSMAVYAYPRLRLTNEGTACVVVDDDLERLEQIKKDFQKTEKGLWHKSAVGMLAEQLNPKFFLVGTWSEEHVVLVFSSSSSINRLGVCPTFERWINPGDLWKDILEAYPLLLDYQESAHGQQGGSRSLPGAGLFYQKQVSSRDHSRSFHYVTLVVPLLGTPHALMFANDFVAQYSPISLQSNGGLEYRANVRVVKMGLPVLKEDGNWDGPDLRNDQWLDGVDKRFAVYSDTLYS